MRIKVITSKFTGVFRQGNVITTINTVHNLFPKQKLLLRISSCSQSLV
jgi:hypothetical protein